MLSQNYSNAEPVAESSVAQVTTETKNISVLPVASPAPPVRPMAPIAQAVTVASVATKVTMPTSAPVAAVLASFPPPSIAPVVTTVEPEFSNGLTKLLQYKLVYLTLAFCGLCALISGNVVAIVIGLVLHVPMFLRARVAGLRIVNKVSKKTDIAKLVVLFAWVGLMTIGVFAEPAETETQVDQTFQNAD